jgi:outer membrane protein assembly factor BamB
VGSREKPIYAIKPGAAGDISVDEANTSNEYILWSDWRAAPYNPSTLIYQDQLYVLMDRGMLSSMNPKTGDYFYEKQKIPRDRSGFTSSPWAYNGKIFCLSEDGDTFVFKAGPTFELLQVNSLQEDDMCMATPAIAGKKLLIRSSERVYCIEK